jgi:hypothetical protein
VGSSERKTKEKSSVCDVLRFKRIEFEFVALAISLACYPPLLLKTGTGYRVISLPGSLPGHRGGVSLLRSCICAFASSRNMFYPVLVPSLTTHTHTHSDRKTDACAVPGFSSAGSAGADTFSQQFILASCVPRNTN